MIHWDFKSFYKSIWLTKHLLITWRYEGLIKDLDVRIYWNGDE